MVGGLYGLDDPKGYNKKRSRVPKQLSLLVILVLGVSTVVLYYKSGSHAKTAAKLQEQLTVVRLQADNFKQDLERNSVTVTGRDRTIQDLQKRIDQLKSELEGERKAAGMERQETARCRQEYSALSNSVVQLQAELAGEKQKAATGNTAQLDAVVAERNTVQQRLAECDRQLLEERQRSTLREHDLLKQATTLATSVQQLNNELTTLPCRTTAGTAAGTLASTTAARALQEAAVAGIVPGNPAPGYATGSGVASETTYIPTSHQQANPPPPVGGINNVPVATHTVPPPIDPHATHQQQYEQQQYQQQQYDQQYHQQQQYDQQQYQQQQQQQYQQQQQDQQQQQYQQQDGGVGGVPAGPVPTHADIPLAGEAGVDASAGQVQGQYAGGNVWMGEDYHDHDYMAHYGHEY